MGKKFGAGLGVLLTLGAIAGGVLFFEERYAKAEDLNKQQLSIQKQGARLDLKILQDRVWVIKRDMREIQERCNTGNPYEMGPADRDHYLDLSEEITAIDKEIDMLMKTVYGQPPTRAATVR